MDLRFKPTFTPSSSFRPPMTQKVVTFLARTLAESVFFAQLASRPVAAKVSKVGLRGSSHWLALLHCLLTTSGDTTYYPGCSITSNI